MTTYLDAQNHWHADPARPDLECPHCRAVAPMSVLAAPDFGLLQQTRPAATGVVMQCRVCHAPVFLRYRIRGFSAGRVEFQPGPDELERPREQFNLAYLPAAVAGPFAEALECYGHGLHLAFATLCRLTARAIFADRGERGRLKIFDQATEVRDLAGVDDATFDVVRRVIFDSDLERGGQPPAVNRVQAAVLLETMKDLLHQTYVRGARLRKTLEMRRLFAGDAAEPPPPAQDPAVGTG